MNYSHLIFVFSLLGILNFFGCSTNEKLYEYKVISYLGYTSRTDSDAFRATSITPDEKELSKLGDEGWEIATSYLEMETAYPNFGKEQYHTGIKTNIRPHRLVIILKRVKGVYKEKSK